jgi:translation elongation factor EF-Ts
VTPVVADLGPTPGFVTARLAVLIDRFHVTLGEIAVMTDHQIVRLYFHKRDRDGVILFPEAVTSQPDRPETLEDCLMGLAAMRPLLTDENYQKAVEAVRAKFAKKEAGGGPEPAEQQSG